MIDYIFAFFVGGIVTASITYFEIAGHPLISRMAALFPVFTWLSYIFIGHIEGAEAVSKHSLYVLLGTIFCWIPYMLVIHFAAPRLGTGKAILLALVVFTILALIFIKVYKG